MAKLFEEVNHVVTAELPDIAEQRFGDAEALAKTGDDTRANGVVYLAGFTIEILLKRQLIIQIPSLANRTIGASDPKLHKLVWQSHDLEAIVRPLASLQAALKAGGERGGRDAAIELKKVCAAWSIQARYAARRLPMAEAIDFLERVRMLKEVLK